MGQAWEVEWQRASLPCRLLGFCWLVWAILRKPNTSLGKWAGDGQFWNPYIQTSRLLVAWLGKLGASL